MANADIIMVLLCLFLAVSAETSSESSVANALRESQAEGDLPD